MPNNKTTQLITSTSTGSQFTVFKSCDIKVLCNKSKPYEVINFIKDANYNILFSLMSNAEETWSPSAKTIVSDCGVLKELFKEQ